jgi:hypothetical protein
MKETRTAHPELPPTVAKLARVQIEELVPATGAPFRVRYLFDEDPDGSYGWVNRIAGEVLTVSNPEEKGRLVRLYGGRWLLAEGGNALPGFQPVTGVAVAGHRLVLHETLAATPELRWASRVHERTSLSGALELARSDLFRPATDVVLPGTRDRAPHHVGATAEMRVAYLEPDRVQIDVAAPSDGHVVWSRTFFPNWKATIDGLPTRVLLANGRDLAIAVPGGRHRIEIDWSSQAFRVGVFIQLAAILAILAIALLRFRRRGDRLSNLHPP